MSNRFVLPLTASLSVSYVVFNDTMIKLEEVEAGYAITAQRGSDVQQLIIPKPGGTEDNNPRYADDFTADTAPQYANHLLFVGDDGKITPLALGEGLEIVDGKLVVSTSIAVALVDDGAGNVSMTGATLTDDGAGNATLHGAALSDDGNGNVIIGG